MTAPHTHPVVPGVIPGPGMCPACDAAERRRMDAIMAALGAGVHWTLAVEAAATTALSQDPEVGTHEVDTITCPRCGRTSHNPNDVREGYCGACHDWTTPRLPGWLHDDPDGFRIVDRD